MKSQRKSKSINKFFKDLPDSPGVYIFRGLKNKILYIGKATSLKDRVRSYFNKDIVETRSPLVFKMLSLFKKIDHIKTDSVLEALVLEAHLIKKYQPEANIKEKDNRSFNFVIITKESFPRVLIVRGREIEKNTLTKVKSDYEIAYSFGPFPNGSQLKEAMKIVRKLFPFRDKCIPASELKSGQKPKACFNRQIGLCPGVCSGEIDQKEYKNIIKNIILFFESDKKRLIDNLQKQMKDFAKKREFEKAQKMKKTLYTLEHIQDISLIKEENTSLKDTEVFRIESYDIAHMNGKNVVGGMSVLEHGEIKLSDYRKFKIKNNPGVNDTKALAEILSRRLAHIEWRFPDLIVVDGGVAQKNVAEKVLKENGLVIPVVSVVKDDRHKPREILGDKKWLKYEKEILVSNAEVHRYAIRFHTKLRNKIISH